MGAWIGGGREEDDWPEGYLGGGSPGLGRWVRDGGEEREAPVGSAQVLGFTSLEGPFWSQSALGHKQAGGDPGLTL